MSLLRLPFVLGAAATMHVAVSPPHVAAPDEQVKSNTFRERYVARLAIPSHVLLLSGMWSVALAESAAILSPYVPSLAALSLPPAPAILPPAFVAGSLLITSGGLIRWLCYRTLHRFFTFELSIQKDHKLVTKGPYSVVRHPSYTGTVLLTIGLFLMHGHPGSWLRTSGVLDFTPFKFMAIGFGGIMMTISTILFGRAAHEDKMMKSQFGEEWDRWARVVRYRMIPGIY
ncbi:hypothetical protein BU15DRAFT_44234 [Melanogaster broomeanus]|nr:hypothetical protein BU15DRAFT_44234 [Melanogaster broomeanus]